MYIANDGKGENLTIEVLDGMMCHNGEVLEKVYSKEEKDKDKFLKDFELSCKSHDYASKIKPMTLEGCVVRISDVIAYIGRDIEDAILLNVIDREDIPDNIVKVLGNNNSDIVNSIVLDIVNNSFEKGKIILSDEVYNAMNELLKFNYKNIYNNANTSSSLAYYKEGFKKLYYHLLEDLNNNKEESKIYKSFLYNMEKDYINNTDNKKIVIDFIAGMTDDYFILQLDECVN